MIYVFCSSVCPTGQKHSIDDMLMMLTLDDASTHTCCCVVVHMSENTRTCCSGDDDVVCGRHIVSVLRGGNKTSIKL